MEMAEIVSGCMQFDKRGLMSAMIDFNFLRTWLQKQYTERDF